MSTLTSNPKGDQPWPPFKLAPEDEHNALVEALTLLRRWRKHEFADDKTEDYRLFSETGNFCSVTETALGMDPQNPPRNKPTGRELPAAHPA